MNRTPRPLTGPSAPAVKGAALVGKALDLLNLIGEAAPISAADLTARTGWPRASVYRILSALTAGGYARLDPREHGYVLGYRLLELAQHARDADNLIDIAAPELRRLRNLTGETAYLVALQGDEAMSLSRLESPHAHRSLSIGHGVRRPLHCTAPGKAMLARLPAAEIERRIEAPRLTQMTAASITDPDELRLHLRDVNARGFAIDDEETLDGVRSVGAAIVDPDGRVLAGISIAGPAYRLTPGRAMQLGPEIAAAARQIGRRMAETRPLTTDPAGAQPLAAAPDAAARGVSPIWDARRARLLWTDARAPGVFATDAQRTIGAMPPQPAPASQLLLGPNGPIALLPGAIAGVDAAGALHVLAAPGLAGVTAMRAARDGTVWAARRDGDDARSGIGPLRAGRVTPIWRLPGPVTALAWDHARDTLYAAASAQRTVHALRVGAPARLLARLPAACGAPSALAADVEGRVWVALLDGWGIARLNEFGDVDATLALPAPRPTGLAFGGPALRTLFITTSRDGQTEDAARHAPLSGRVFTLEMSAAGWAEPTSILDLG